MKLPRVAWVMLLAATGLAVLFSALWQTSLLADEDPARQLVERGEFKQARAMLAPRLQANPRDAETAWLMSQVKIAFAEEKAGLELAEQAVALDGGKAAYHLQLAEACGQMAQKAGPLKGLSLGKRFRRETEAAIRLDPRLVDARFDLMMFYLKAPGIAGGDKKKARALADTIAGLDPVRGLIARGRLAIELKDSVGAGEFYGQAVEAYPKSREAQMTAASFYAGPSQSRWDRVEHHARAALELDPRRAGPYALLAGTYAHLERWPDLEAILERAESECPGNLNPHYQAGRTLLADGHDLARAERYFRKYLSGEPEGLSPTLAHAHWRLGLVLEKQGRASEAIAELETALRLNPGLEDVKKDLKRMKRA